MRDGGDRMFLAVVRRQPVVVRTDERLEERPCPARETLRRKSVWSLVSRASRRASGRLIHQAIPGDDEPQEEDRRGHRQCGRRGGRQQDRRRRGDDRGDPHRLDRRGQLGAAGWRRPGAAIGLVGGRRIPFEQPSMRNQHPPRGACDRIEVDRRLVRQEGERQHRLRDVPAGHACGGGEVLPQQHFVRLAQQVQHEGARRRQQEDGDHRQRPQPGVRKHGPPEQQQQRQRRPGRDCAAGCRRASTAKAPTADCAAGACRGRARAEAATPAAASRRESSGAGG